MDESFLTMERYASEGLTTSQDKMVSMVVETLSRRCIYATCRSLLGISVEIGQKWIPACDGVPRMVGQCCWC
jgi:hypothetical protein